MRMVMPAVLGAAPDVPFLGMARFETGPNGNPHWHGIGYGRGNPRMDAVGEKLVAELEKAELEAEGREGEEGRDVGIAGEGEGSSEGDNNDSLSGGCGRRRGE